MVDLDWESKKPESEKHDTPGMSMSPLGTASTLIAAFSWDEELGSTFYEGGSTTDTIARYFRSWHWSNGNRAEEASPMGLRQQYLAEYVLMCDRELIKSHLNVKLLRTTPEGYEVAMYPLMPYYKWERVAAPSKSMEFRDLMPQPQLAKWLHAHFLKICLPYKRGRAFDLVDAPLNLTVFIRLLIQVAELGYPAHWLSKLVGELQRLGDDDGQGASERRAQAPGYNQGLAPPKDLGRALEDGTGDTTTSARYVRREVVRVLTTFKWATDARTATFWLRRGDMEEMVREDSLLYVWRTDFWDRQSGGGA
ncbi:hypothetical protein PG987_001131 [Apiospora arundinis]